MTQIAPAQKKYEPCRYPEAQPACFHGTRAQDAIPISALAPMLIASPHPDDETLGCGGLLARCAEMACPVTVLAITNGEASHPGDSAWREELAATRKREQLAALTVLGLDRPDIVYLDLPDGGLEAADGELRKRVLGVILDVIVSRRVRSVFVPAVDDCHGDHRETARLLAQAARAHPVDYFFSYQIWPPEVRQPQVFTNEVEYLHDITDLVGLKRHAIHQHRSQMRPLDPAHAKGFRMPRTLLQEKLKGHESYALVHDIAAWIG